MTTQEERYTLLGYEPEKNRDTTERERCLDSAKSMVMASREQSYGSPSNNFSDAAKLFDVYNKAKLRKSGDPTIEPHDIAVFNILQKVARLATSPTKADTWDDIAGYAACGAEVSSAS